jgi:hypothetical protein
MDPYSRILGFLDRRDISHTSIYFDSDLFLLLILIIYWRDENWGNFHSLHQFGLATVQTVSCWLPTAAARVRSQVGPSRICGWQSGTGWGCLQVFRLPCKLSFHRLLHAHHHISSLKVKVILRLTVSRPVRLGVRHLSGTRDQFFFLFEIVFRQLVVCYFDAPSLTRGRVCNLRLLQRCNPLADTLY